MNKIVGQIRSDTKGRLEAVFVRHLLVLETALNVERVRKDNDLFVLDALRVVVLAHHLDVLGWVSGVLSDTGEELSVRLHTAVRSLESICRYPTLDGADGLTEGVQKLPCTERVRERDGQVRSEAADPVTQRLLSCVLVVADDGGRPMNHS